MNKPITKAWEEFERESLNRGAPTEELARLKWIFVAGAMAYGLNTFQNPAVSTPEALLVSIDEVTEDLSEIMNELMSRDDHQHGLGIPS